MITAAQQEFLEKAFLAATAAEHVFPRIAACEAALESEWGVSELARAGNNLFGMKQQAHPEFGTISIPTREFLNHEWVTVNAQWVKYPDQASCFRDRMETLKRLAPAYPHYALALEAKDPQTYVTEVSLSWSTDPDRAAKVLQIFRLHAAALRLESV